MTKVGGEEIPESVKPLGLETGNLGNTGCDQLNEEVLLCMADHKDWRKCQMQVKAFKQCFEDFQVLKLWYYAGKISEQEFFELSRRRRFGGELGSRTNVQHPYENSAFNLSFNVDDYKKPAAQTPESDTTSSAL